MENMVRVLWAQRKSIYEKDLFSRNGNRLDNDSLDAISLYHFLVNLKLPEIYKDGNLIVRRVKHINTKFEYIIHSNFNEVDSDNRKVAYMMYIGANDIDEFMENMKSEAAIYGYTCKNNDMEKIKNAIIQDKRHQNVKTIIYIGGIVVLISLFATYIMNN